VDTPRATTVAFLSTALRIPGASFIRLQFTSVHGERIGPAKKSTNPFVASWLMPFPNSHQSGQNAPAGMGMSGRGQ